MYICIYVYMYIQCRAIYLQHMATYMYMHVLPSKAVPNYIVCSCMSIYEYIPNSNICYIVCSYMSIYECMPNPNIRMYAEFVYLFSQGKALARTPRTKLNHTLTTH